jgi:DNA-directed RNA polymerase subunit RPC12/RpoP
MSEFKYACPICGQHMMCDESQAGSVMDCPTCFQKIVAPQAPAPGSKFVLTGSKFSEKKITAPVQDSSIIEPPKKFPAALVIGLILGFMAATAAAIYWATIIHPRKVTPENPPAQTNATPVAKPAPKPAPVAPPASDVNWSLNLDDVTNLPDTKVAGRIHGQDFIAERVYLQNGILTLRVGTKGPMEFGCTVNFGGALAEALAGQVINVSSNADTAARVTLRWKNDEGSGKDNYDSGYAMRLEFGTLANNKLPGKIYLCTPDDEKSYLLGSFNADARKPKPKTPK